MGKNGEKFSDAYHWLVLNKLVDDQKDLSLKTDITPTTISRILTGKVKPKIDTLRKFNSAFDNIFNMNYLLGNSTIMLVEDLEAEQSSRASESTEIPYTPVPSWASNLIEIMTAQIKENEALNRELRLSIEEVRNALNRLYSVLDSFPKHTK